MNILVTGGAGYIGNHTLIELINASHTPIVVDNFSNSSPEAIRRVEKITGSTIEVHNFDLCDTQRLDELFVNQKFDAVIHFAGLKAVGESVVQPLRYYQNNIVSTLRLLDAMSSHGVKKLIFSSSATVYGEPEELPLKETSRVGVGITNPYGQTKFMIEQILRDISISDPSYQITSLRYFNPAGAHPSGLIGEDPGGTPNNLMPFISQVAVGQRAKLGVFGDDYDTPDGTALRDYIHVVDLARGHVAALNGSQSGYHIYNLGTGNPTSVLEMVDAFKRASGQDINYEILPRRTGDIAINYADATKAATELGWKAEKTIEDMCRDSWNWQSNNLRGYTAS